MFCNKLVLNFVVGGMLFVIGFFKKIVLVDGIVFYVNEVFNFVEIINGVLFEVVWIGVLVYMF